MNSEELEQSLRTEFESYLKGVLAGIKQDVSEFQKNFEAEFEKHKAQLDESIKSLSARFDSDPEFDRGFSESVVEHLRLARDEGATITANAIGAAEKLRDESAPVASHDLIRDAIEDITSQNSQSAILKSLVEQAGNFAAHGAFFIVKRDHFVGWKALGTDSNLDDGAVREVHFSMSADTVLSVAATSLSMREAAFGEHADDKLFLESLGFGSPDRMYAIPLIARGRGVAVLYADHGSSGGNVDTDALRTLVRVAGLTVELLAALNEARAQQDSVTPSPEEAQPISETSVTTPAVETTTETAAGTEPVEYYGAVSYDDAEIREHASDPSISEGEAAVEEVSYFEPQIEPETNSSAGDDDRSRDFAFSTVDDDDKQEVDQTEPAEEYALNGNGGSAVKAAEAPVNVASEVATSSRYSNRNVDLPIEVSEGERVDHTKARRFARLLVSEIKLYNEQKVAQGREAKNLYDRLREEIDRSREMYEKRVEPRVAAKFDYFHYELVNGLADGSDDSLGRSYPGSSL